jgi:hypothetical protein
MNKPTKPTDKTLDTQLREGELRAVLRSTTNHGMSHYQGIAGSLYVNTQAYWYGRDRDETFHTSALKDYALDGKMLTLYTLNSTYVFEILQGEFDVFLFTRAPEALIQHQDLRGIIKLYNDGDIAAKELAYRLTYVAITRASSDVHVLF